MTAATQPSANGALAGGAVLRITVEDLVTGEVDVVEMPAGEYMLIATTPCYLAHTQTYRGGRTAQLTIKDRTVR